ncbi:MAG: hypothetical protein GX282_08185 [Campylobacteraceae bacterium]|nr:hypothetical protein [Campylobacteraceae bacterium]
MVGKLKAFLLSKSGWPKIIKDTLFFLFQVVFAGIVSGLIVFLLFNIWADIDLNSLNELKDPISVANSFMVYVTIIFAITALLFTLGGIWFQWKISERESIVLSDNMDKILDKINEDEKIKSKIIDKIVSNKEIIESLSTKFGESFKAIDIKINNLEKNKTTLKNDIKNLENELNKLRMEKIELSLIKEEQFPAINKNTEDGD